MITRNPCLSLRKCVRAAPSPQPAWLCLAAVVALSFLCTHAAAAEAGAAGTATALDPTVTAVVASNGVAPSPSAPLIANPRQVFAPELIDVKSRLNQLKLQPRDTGGFDILLRDGAVTHRVSEQQFFELLHQRSEQLRAAGWVFLLLNITSPIGFAWVTVGLLGQILFTGRMVIQWIASEREKRSVIPNAFWWMSLLGASMLIVYFLWRKDIVGVLGQSTGWVIYARNLWLIHLHPKSP